MTTRERAPASKPAPAVRDRPVVVLGLLWAGLSFARSLLATVTGVKVRQGPSRFGTSAVFRTRPEPRVDDPLPALGVLGYLGSKLS